MCFPAKLWDVVQPREAAALQRATPDPDGEVCTDGGPRPHQQPVQGLRAAEGFPGGAHGPRCWLVALRRDAEVRAQFPALSWTCCRGGGKPSRECTKNRGWGGAWWHLGSGQSLASELCHPEIADSSLRAVCWTLLGRSCLTLPRMLKAFAENEKWKIFAQFLQKLGSWAVSAALDSWACTRVFPNNAVYVRFKHLGFLWPKRTEDAWRTSRTQLFGFFSFSQVQCGVLANLSSLFCIFKMFIGQCKALLKVPWYK